LGTTLALAALWGAPSALAEPAPKLAASEAAEQPKKDEPVAAPASAPAAAAVAAPSASVAVAAPSASVAVAAPSASVAVAAPPASVAPSAPVTEAEKPAKGGPPVASYILLGAGAVGIGVGSYFGLQALSSKSEVEQLCPSARGKRTCPASASDELSANARNAVLADAGFVVGMAALAIGGYLLFSGGKAPAATATQLQPSAGPHGGGFNLTGTF